MSSTPRYHVVAPGGVYANGQLYPKGAEVTYQGWPRQSELEPLNVPARRIARYYRQRHSAWGGLPPSPWSATHRDFYLPGLPLQIAGHEVPGLVHDHEVDASLPALPEYELRLSRWIGKREFQAGERVRWIGWPLNDMTAANHPARQVSAYFAEHKDHPDLAVRGPWCWMHGLHLPKLKPLAPRVPPPRENVGAIASEVARATGQSGGGLVFGTHELPPYADPRYRHLYANVASSHANRAKPLPDRRRTLPDSAKTLPTPAQE